MAIEVFPTANDIGGAGTGRSSTEENIAQFSGIGIGQSTILSGFTAAEGVGLNVLLAPGRASIGGYIIRNQGFLNVPVTDETTGYLWLQLPGADVYNATEPGWVETADLSSPPDNSALVTKFIAAGGAVTDTDDRMRREGAGMITGSYTGDGGTDDFQEIDLGLTPRFVIARNNAPVGVNWKWAFSNVFPGNVEWPDFDDPWDERRGLPFFCTRCGGNDDDTIRFDERITAGGGLGIIPRGFEAYNDYSEPGGMNANLREYYYIAWF